MSLKGIRKALNGSPDEQLASILAANNGVLPTHTIRRPEPRRAVYWLGADKSVWYGFVAKNVLVRQGNPPRVQLAWQLCFESLPVERKPRAGLILGDGKLHWVYAKLKDGNYIWLQQRGDTPLHQRDDRWYYSGKIIDDWFLKLWGLKVTAIERQSAHNEWETKQTLKKVGKSDSG